VFFVQVRGLFDPCCLSFVLFVDADFFFSPKKKKKKVGKMAEHQKQAALQEKVKLGADFSISSYAQVGFCSSSFFFFFVFSRFLYRITRATRARFVSPNSQIVLTDWSRRP
jgi:hypothetical protein